MTPTRSGSARSCPPRRDDEIDNQEELRESGHRRSPLALGPQRRGLGLDLPEGRVVDDRRLRRGRRDRSRCPTEPLIMRNIKQEKITKLPQSRERHTGRYGFVGKFDRLCVCGQPLGLHLAEAPHPGLVDVNGVLADSGCPRFRPARTKSKREK